MSDAANSRKLLSELGVERVEYKDTNFREERILSGDRTFLSPRKVFG